jgi:hypothetical protein
MQNLGLPWRYLMLIARPLILRFVCLTLEFHVSVHVQCPSCCCMMNLLCLAGATYATCRTPVQGSAYSLHRPFGRIAALINALMNAEWTV